ncbi:MFS-type transporter involved in bile tolerance (Atg22 family) [Solirubrobacter pauli]|uniref:MFS-type transporter involved in bile tolerance (Atg22 family) n=1 Tax=Solirubrobacter pauli TaxID=166793 RepID=A0A660L3S6_9ACTN|nr:MFS transporter [Solirubrobacter pauli]RKQ86170.1 MFS-type transporter involved in bile tolerance (Atg22 family) [Solirubrobacter pauli]
MTADTGARALRAPEKRAVALLGIPTLALALTSTVVTTYTPVVAREFVESSAVIGMIIGLEGLVALWLPLVVGAWSDRLDTKLGGRLPFLLAATPMVIGGLVAMAIMGSVAVLAVAAFVFFAGYFIAYEPYRALYPDAVGEEVAGRAQATQAVWRGAGTGIALMGGGLLLAWGQAAPFVAAAIVYALCIGLFSFVLIRRGVPRRPRNEQHAGARAVFDLVRGDTQLKAFLVANALWELSLAALKTFVVLYVTQEMGFSQTESSLIIGGVAIIVLFAALASGPLADRYGSSTVLRWALPIHGIGFLVPLLFEPAWVVTLAVPFIALGGGVIMALPYAVLIPLMPDNERGALTGYYSVSRGMGIWLGPLLAGIAVSVAGSYQAVWGVCAAATLLSLWPLRRL